MKEFIGVEPIEKFEVFATLVVNEELHLHSYNQIVFVECETLEMSEKNLAATNYNHLHFERNNLVRRQLNDPLDKAEQNILSSQIEEYTNKLYELKKRCLVTVQDIYPNVKFDANSYLYNVKKEAFTDQNFVEISNELAGTWAQEQITNQLAYPMELNVKVTLSSGKILQSKRTIIKL